MLLCASAVCCSQHFEEKLTCVTVSPIWFITRSMVEAFCTQTFRIHPDSIAALCRLPAGWLRLPCRFDIFFASPSMMTSPIKRMWSALRYLCTETMTASLVRRWQPKDCLRCRPRKKSCSLPRRTRGNIVKTQCYPSVMALVTKNNCCDFIHVPMRRDASM